MAKLIKPTIFIVALIPFALIVRRIVTADFGPDPVQELAVLTGEWALRFLVIALAMTPLQQITRRPEFVRNRRMIGLFALFYATCHFAVWMTFMLEFQWMTIGEEIVERPYITIGFSAFLILVALGATSPKFMVRKLGKNWKRLHRLVYVAAVLAIVHQLWIQRTDVSEVVFYGSLVLGLLIFRLLRSIRRQYE